MKSTRSHFLTLSFYILFRAPSTQILRKKYAQYFVIWFYPLKNIDDRVLLSLHQICKLRSAEQVQTFHKDFFTFSRSMDCPLCSPRWEQSPSLPIVTTTPTPYSMWLAALWCMRRKFTSLTFLTLLPTLEGILVSFLEQGNKAFHATFMLIPIWVFAAFCPSTMTQKRCWSMQLGGSKPNYFASVCYYENFSPCTLLNNVPWLHLMIRS